MKEPRSAIPTVLMAAALSSCGGGEAATGPDGPSEPDPSDEAGIVCDIDESDIFFGGVARDGIPALQDPELVPVDSEEAYYLQDGDRVIGIEVSGRAIAVPHNVLWWHEIVNFDFPGGPRVAVTYCPLTGSSMVFDRSSVEGSDFGVSGLIFQNNLIMFDRRSETLFPQMMRRGACGPNRTLTLTMYPAVEMRWDAWRALHPDGEVISGAIGFNRDYTRYPYGDYEDLDNDGLLFSQDDVDRTRPVKERVLGLVLGLDGGVAFPFGELARKQRRAIGLPAHGGTVVLWDRDAESAVAFLTTVGGTALTFDVVDGGFRDQETGSTWRLDGVAVEGPLEGTRLEPVPDAYVAFWFAWAEFQPETSIWRAAHG